MTNSPKTGFTSRVPAGDFRIAWPTLSIIFAVTGAASLATLIIVVSVKGVDPLATVALALAILSFAVQLIVTMIQSESNAKLNSDTQTALASIRASSDALLSNQNDQFNTVLGAALSVIPAAMAEASGDLNSDDESQSSAPEVPSVDAVQDSFAKLLRDKLEDQGFRWHVDLSSPKTASMKPLHDGLSEGEFATARAALEMMDGSETHELLRIGRRIKANESAGHQSTARYNRNSSGRTERHAKLIEKGLLVEVSAPADGQAGKVVYALTELGTLVARSLM